MRDAIFFQNAAELLPFAAFLGALLFFLPKRRAAAPITKAVSFSKRRKVSDVLPRSETSPTSVTAPIIAAPTPPPPIADGATGSPAMFSADEAELARRLYSNYNSPPSDRPDALLLVDKPNVKVYKRKLPKFDEYESNLWFPVQPETLLAMLCDVNERVQWDASTMRIDVLKTSGPASFKHIHKQDGDDMTVLWLLETPWPLSNREYVLNRRVCVLYGDGQRAAVEGATAANGVVYSKVDTADDGPANRELCPNNAKGCKRVLEHYNVQAIWADPSGSGTRFRGLYREDPMMSLPKWFLSWMMDKTMPSSMDSMIKTAVEYEKRLMAAKASK